MSNAEIAEFLISKYKELYPSNKYNISYYTMAGKHAVYIYLNLDEYTYRVHEFTYKNSNEYSLKLMTRSDQIRTGSSLTD